MRIETICPTCKKATHSEWEKNMFGVIMTKLACGHLTSVAEMVRTDNQQKKADPWEFLNAVERYSDLFYYQKEGVQHGLESNLNDLVADEPGLGKTMQALLMLAAKYDNFNHILIVAPAGLTVQWAKCFRAWCRVGRMDIPCVHSNTKRELVEEEKIHIVSSSMLAYPAVLQSILKYGFDLMIVDECHYFKNEDSNRTNAIMQIAKVIPHKIFLSGTPIVNRVAEYFPVLHMLRPADWPDRGFLNNLCERDDNGKPMHLREDRKEYFFEKTRKYIIRRRKKDVLKDMPDFRRDFIFVTGENNKNFVSVYNALLDEIEQILSSTDTNMTGAILGVIARVRYATGVAKIPLIIEKALEILEGDEDNTRKLAIGVHHIDVMNTIARKLEEAGYGVAKMSSQSALEKDRIQSEFANGKRVLVATILGCAEGRNMQFCDYCILGEREWNPAKEEQFEQRFWRYGQKNAVIAAYLMMEKTLDHWFHDMVEVKRGVTGSALDSDIATDGSKILELARKMTSVRLKVTGV